MKREESGATDLTASWLPPAETSLHLRQSYSTLYPTSLSVTRDCEVLTVHSSRPASDGTEASVQSCEDRLDRKQRRLALVRV